ncbi:MAG: PIG-L family deacetylase [Dehalococcoidia bacterium]|nr:PIG-L family deacetylase [Dehalococcoidia bacterium]
MVPETIFRPAVGRPLRGAGLEDIWTSEETPLTDDDGRARRALVIAAHPDDADFGAAGTAALWSREGWEFYYLVCTDGSKGTDNLEVSPFELIRIRREEQREAARVAGVKEVFFLDNEDGELQYTRDFLGQVVRHIRMLKPDAVFTHDPTTLFHREQFINHPDHRCTGLVTVDAVYPTARDHLNFPTHAAEGLETHKVLELYCWGSNEPNFDVDISEVLDVKFDALLSHRSQFGQREDFVKFATERWKDEEGRVLERFRRVTLFR